MAVAQLVGDQRFELGLVGREHCLGEGGDRLGNGRGVGRFGECGRAGKGGCAQCDKGCGGDLAAVDGHCFLRFSQLRGMRLRRYTRLDGGERSAMIGGKESRQWTLHSR